MASYFGVFCMVRRVGCLLDEEPGPILCKVKASPSNFCDSLLRLGDKHTLGIFKAS